MFILFYSYISILSAVEIQKSAGVRADHGRWIDPDVIELLQF